jgi:hypothetical protein
MQTAVLLLSVLVGLACASFLVLRRRKQQHYRRLEARQQSLLPSLVAKMPFTPRECPPSFAERIVALPDFLPAPLFEKLREAALRAKKTERSYLPGHKKGGTISYAELHELAPEIVAHFQSPALIAYCSSLVGEKLTPTPLHDQSACSLLFYEKPGDHIGWHYDHNFYRGRHFTVLLPLVNERRGTGRVSSAQLMIQKPGRDEVVPTQPNTLVVFEGAVVRHKVTPLGDGETRIILSMTYCTDPTAPLAKAVARRIKDVAFFGIRALWT